jgi:hypothetical protein
MASGYPPFDSYNDEFRSLIRDLEQCLHSQDNDNDNGELSPSSSSSSPPSDLGRLLRECEELLLQMKVEARGAPGSSLKRELMDIYQACQMQLASYQTLHSKRDELFAGHHRHSLDSNNPKDRLLATRDHVESQNLVLEGALRSIRETEELAGEIGQELGRNRESLQKAQGNVGNLSGMVKQADGHLKGMMRKWF